MSRPVTGVEATCYFYRMKGSSEFDRVISGTSLKEGESFEGPFKLHRNGSSGIDFLNLAQSSALSYASASSLLSCHHLSWVVEELGSTPAPHCTII